jgi:hypothetical protein
LQVKPGSRRGARNLRHYKGLALNGFAGQALYIGPTFYAAFGERYFVSAAWSIQVWGAVPGSSGMLDLINFERHQAKLRLGVSI